MRRWCVSILLRRQEGAPVQWLVFTGFFLKIFGSGGDASVSKKQNALCTASGCYAEGVINAVPPQFAQALRLKPQRANLLSILCNGKKPSTPTQHLKNTFSVKLRDVFACLPDAPFQLPGLSEIRTMQITCSRWSPFKIPKLFRICGWIMVIISAGFHSVKPQIAQESKKICRWKPDRFFTLNPQCFYGKIGKIEIWEMERNI